MPEPRAQRAGPFLPGELVNPRLHATMDGLGLRGFAEAHQAELAQVSAAEALSPTAAALLALLDVLPRPHGRPLGIGLQLSAPALAAVLGRSERMVHYALEELAERKLVARFTQIRSVATLTRERPHPLKSFQYVGKGGAVRWTRKAHCTAVLYPTPAGLAVWARHGWSSAAHLGRPHDRRTVRVGLLASLWETLSQWIRTLARRCASLADHCTPYESKTRRVPSTAARDGNGDAVPPDGGPPDAHDGQGPPAPDSARDGGRRGAPGGGGSLTAEVERCWSAWAAVERVATTPAPRGFDRARWALGYGYEGQATGELRRVWTPILTAAARWPEAWARGTADDRAALTAAFQPLARELRQRIAAGWPPPPPPAE